MGLKIFAICVALGYGVAMLIKWFWMFKILFLDDRSFRSYHHALWAWILMDFAHLILTFLKKNFPEVFE